LGCHVLTDWNWRFVCSKRQNVKVRQIADGPRIMLGNNNLQDYTVKQESVLCNAVKFNSFATKEEHNGLPISLQHNS
jgi:hypothetical protein